MGILAHLCHLLPGHLSSKLIGSDISNASEGPVSLHNKGGINVHLGRFDKYFILSKHRISRKYPLSFRRDQ